MVYPTGRAEAMSTARWACLGLLMLSGAGAMRAGAAAPPRPVEERTVGLEVLLFRAQPGTARVLANVAGKWSCGNGKQAPAFGLLATPRQQARIIRALERLQKQGGAK